MLNLIIHICHFLHLGFKKVKSNEPLPVAHPVVDDWIDTGVSHGEPVEEEVDVANIGSFGDGGVVEYEDEVYMVLGPADHEDDIFTI